MSMKSGFGSRRLVGQQKVREQLERTLLKGRASHAYLFSGPAGSGKNAIVLAFAEYLNGVSNLSDLGNETASKKSGWFSHPDIHFFMPLPKAVTESAQAAKEEMTNRLRLLKEDPYNMIDFKFRPVLDSDTSSKSRKAFYPVSYFQDEIRPKCRLKPNEGRFTVVIITEIETMSDLVANTFLKLLEEPPGNVIFLLTTVHSDRILPTIWSRCQHVRLAPLSEEEVAGALTRYDGFSESDALSLARISGGNYSLARFIDLEVLQETNREITEFLRMAYSRDAGALLSIIQDWQSRLNTENQIALCDTLEMKLRDLMIYRETADTNLINQIDQIDVISKFCESLPDARISDMIEHLQSLRGGLYQNVQFKLVFTALAFRFGFLMRGKDPVIPEDDKWRHLPAIHTTYDSP